METTESISTLDTSLCDHLPEPSITLGQQVEGDCITMQNVDKCQRIKIWQQAHYLSDSGIQSATGTHTPSVSSKLGPDDADPEDYFLQPKSGTLPAWSSNFPLSVNPDSSVLSPDTPSASSVMGIDSLGESLAASHSASNVDLRGNRLPEIDTDEAASAIPELVKLIKDEDDQVIIYQSSMMVFQLSKSEAIDALIKSKDMIDCIISALNRTTDPETVRFLAGTLYNISQTQTGLKVIFAAQCVPCLVKLLNSPVESVLFYAITTLHNLLLHQEGAKAVVRQSGCLLKMTALLRKNNIKFLTICTDCLQILAYAHQESKLQILSSGGPSELVRILRTYQYEKLLWTTVRVVKVLSVCPSNKPAIIAAGGMDALARHLHSSSHRLVLNCLWALRNLSDAATRLDNLQPLLQSLVRLLDVGDSSMITCAAGILSNLTCNNHANKYIVYKSGGIEGLLCAISQPNLKEDILEPCMCALRHLTSRHEEEETARHVIVHQLNGLPIVSRILHAATAGICPELGLLFQSPQTPVVSWMLIKAMIGLLRNLSVNLDSHHAMRDCGLVTGLFLLLYATQYEIAKRNVHATASSNPPFATMVQSVRLEEIVEGICGALHMLAKDHTTRSYLALLKAPNLNLSPNIQPGCSGLAIFVQLLHSPHDSIQRAAAGVLAEISQDRDGLEILASLPGASARFDEMVHSRNEAISTYASAIVMRLAEERRGLVGNPYVFSSHVDALNTPPLPMDTEVYQLSSLHDSATSPILSPTSQSTISPQQFWPQHLSADSTNVSPSPPSNSLTAMLGPPPADCKNSSCSDYCSYWDNCIPTKTCTDPNCICGDGTFSEVQSLKTYHGSRLSNRPGIPNSSAIYPPSFPSSALLPFAEPCGLSSTHNQSTSNAQILTDYNLTNSRKSGYTSFNTSGYISPSSDVYVQPALFKPTHLMEPGPLRNSRTTHQSGGTNLSSLMNSQTLNTDYVSPDLMCIEKNDSDWFDGQGLV